jgi:hypothetical protein
MLHDFWPAGTAQQSLAQERTTETRNKGRDSGADEESSTRRMSYRKEEGSTNKNNQQAATTGANKWR